jgi:hypothetical protein
MELCQIIVYIDEEQPNWLKSKRMLLPEVDVDIPRINFIST